ncbi:hypothetical protein L2K75_004572 [Salmonella enterica]|nr:hypothetical protein [Salmonella enterica]
MELQNQLNKERDNLERLERERTEAEQQGNQAKAAELSQEANQTREYIKTLEQQKEILEEFQPEHGGPEQSGMIPESEQRQELNISDTMKQGDTELTGVVTGQRSSATYQRGGRPTTFRSSIYDVADRMGYNKTTTTTTTSVYVDEQSKDMLEKGVKKVEDLAKAPLERDPLTKLHRDMEQQQKQQEAERQKAADELTAFVRSGTAERGQVQQSDRHQEQAADLSGSFGPASDYKPEPQQEAAQGVEIDGQHFRHMEDGDRVRGEIVNTVEMEDGSKFYAVEATGADWETDRVLVPATEQEHEIGDRIRATMQADEVNTREDANELTR